MAFRPPTSITANLLSFKCFRLLSHQSIQQLSSKNGNIRHTPMMSSPFSTISPYLQYRWMSSTTSTSTPPISPSLQMSNISKDNASAPPTPPSLQMSNISKDNASATFNRWPQFPIRSFVAFGISLVGGGYIISYCNDNQISIKQFLSTALETIETKQLALNDKLLDLFDDYFPLPTEALLPDAEELNYPEFVPTLIIDFNKTIALLEHDRRNGWRVIKRPGAERFFQELSGYYELLIWSDDSFPVAQDAVQKWGLPVIGCLHRDQCKIRKGHYVKDISRLGRKPERMVIIDHDPMAFMFQPENGLLIREFDGDLGDNELDYLIDFLKTIASSPQDIRTQLDKYRSEGVDAGRKFISDRNEMEERANNRRSLGKAFGVGFTSKNNLYGSRVP